MSDRRGSARGVTAKDMIVGGRWPDHLSRATLVVAMLDMRALPSAAAALSGLTVVREAPGNPLGGLESERRILPRLQPARGRFVAEEILAGDEPRRNGPAVEGGMAEQLQSSSGPRCPSHCSIAVASRAPRRPISACSSESSAPSGRSSCSSVSWEGGRGCPITGRHFAREMPSRPSSQASPTQHAGARRMS